MFFCNMRVKTRATPSPSRLRFKVFHDLQELVVGVWSIFKLLFHLVDQPHTHSLIISSIHRYMRPHSLQNHKRTLSRYWSASSTCSCLGPMAELATGVGIALVFCCDCSIERCKWAWRALGCCCCFAAWWSCRAATECTVPNANVGNVACC